ncbi:MAG TPA: bifunctional phosphopantothenoylcysteine decarboxylase/phosphopantothenate--cysteine ligase CoaBC [Solirubrobacteraceae bacterium]|nr:bifunctional phosphopantothenoylcysteine decarboxylase/phosphopantothenate--cysteine ligase CoaBC [Solirubrobacteraceae bacterium]
MARILVGVCGGVAAYKALELVRLLTGEGHAVRVLQSENAQRFVGAASFAALSGAPVLVGEFDADSDRGAYPGEEPVAHHPIGHLELAARADLYVIAPATASTIARLALGAADNMITACALAADCPLLVAPAMNARMYDHPATQANLALLRTRGAHVVGPGAGRLASIGEQGVGRLAEPAEIARECARLLARAADLAGLRVLVTAGGTREPIDAVRFVGNSSSGRMGFALAEAAAARGADVDLVAANVQLATPAAAERTDVGTAAELAAACRERFARCDVLLMAAAVADFAPAQAQADKIKRAGRAALELTLTPTVDVLAELAPLRSDGQTLVGFAAEHGDGAIERAREKLAAKALDAIVVNDVSRADIGFDVAENEVTVIAARGPDVHVPRAAKRDVADAVLDAVIALRGGQ